MEALLGKTVQGKGGHSVDASSLASNDIVGIYFSAHWCPPCRRFTPLLAEYYKKVRAAGKKFEIVFVSSDQDEASAGKYFDEMPWLMVPFGDKAVDKLNQEYGVSGIPTLVLVKGSDGATITKDGRGKVMSDKDGSAFPFH